MKELRFNIEKPPSKMLWTEIPYSLSTILCGTFFECLALHWYASEVIPIHYKDLMDNKLMTFFWIFCIP